MAMKGSIQVVQLRGGDLTWEIALIRCLASIGAVRCLRYLCLERLRLRNEELV